MAMARHAVQLSMRMKPTLIADYNNDYMGDCQWNPHYRPRLLKKAYPAML